MKPVRTLLALSMGLITTWGSAVLAETPNSAQANVDMVRAAYAKLVFATQLSALREAYTSGANSGRLKVTLSSIKTGPVSEIKSQLLSDLVTKPSGRTLSVSPVNWTYTTNGGQVLRAEGATALWTDSGYLAEDWDVSVGALLANGTLDHGYTAYASFTVSLSYLGERRQYPALFLFGSNASGRPMTLPIDHIIGISALQAIIEAPSTPDPLLADRFRTQPATRAFLQSLQAPENCSTESRTQMCCDHGSGNCGVSSETLGQHGFSVSRSMSYIDQGIASPECQFACSTFNTTGSPVTEYSANDTSDHITGYHSGSVQFQSHCTYSGDSLPCVGLCHVAVLNPVTSETGVKTIYSCHQEVTSTTGNDAEGTNTCSAAWGFGVAGCHFCLCGLTVGISYPPANVSLGGGGNDLYKWGWGLTSGPCTTKN